MAVYTPLTQSEISSILTHYDLPALTGFEGISEGVSNTNYLLHFSDATKAILTILEKGESTTDTKNIMDFMDHCRQHGINCPYAYKTTAGDSVTTIYNKPVVLVSFLEGSFAKTLTPNHCQSAGQTLAKMHMASSTFPSPMPNRFGIDKWQNLIHACGNKLDEIQPNLFKELSAELLYLETHLPDDLPRGIGFLDYFPNNLFFDDTTVSGIFDFYFCAEDTFLFDLLIAINAFAFQPPAMTLNINNAQAFLDGYQSVRPLTTTEKKTIPIMGRAAALRFLSTRCYDWLFSRETGNKQHDPLEYIRLLKFYQINQEVPYLS